MSIDVRFVARDAIQRGWQIDLFTTPEAMNHPAYRLVMSECGGRMNAFPIRFTPFPARTSRWRLLQYQHRQWRCLASAYRDVARHRHPDVVFLANLDHCDKILAIRGSPFGRVPFAGIVQAVSFYRRKAGLVAPRARFDAVYERLFRRLLRISSLSALFVIEQPLVQYFSQLRLDTAAKIRYLPNPGVIEAATSRQQARAALGLSAESVVILVYGLLSQRKGVGTLLRCLASAGCPANVVVLLAGHQEAQIETILRSPALRAIRQTGRVIEMRGFLDNDDEARAFSAADIVWLGYHDFYGMSGVLAQAAVAGLPIIACRNGVIGWMTEQYELGELVDAANSTEVLPAIQKLAGDSRLRRKYGSNGLRMASNHDPRKFGMTICNVLSAMGRHAPAS